MWYHGNAILTDFSSTDNLILLALYRPPIYNGNFSYTFFRHIDWHDGSVTIIVEVERCMLNISFYAVWDAVKYFFFLYLPNPSIWLVNSWASKLPEKHVINLAVVSFCNCFDLFILLHTILSVVVHTHTHNNIIITNGICWLLKSPII